MRPRVLIRSGEAGIPIGVFDSGVGGLTVLRALRSAMPAENFVYLGDTARLPYAPRARKPSCAIPCSALPR